MGLPEGLALLAALGFAGSAVTARLGLRDTGIMAGILAGNAVSALILMAVVAIDPPRSVPTDAALWFGAAGLFGGPGLAAAAILLGIRRLGAPTHGPLQGGAYGITISLGAALVLGESVGPLRGLGVAAIVTGGGVLVQAQMEPARLAAAAMRVGAARPPGWPERVRSSFRPGSAFPLVAGATLAASDLVVKSNLETLPHPAFAAGATLLGGTLFWGTILAVVPAARRSLRFGRHGRWFLASGALVGAAFVALNTALGQGDASTVGPIVASEPLAVILLSALFLSGLDRVTGHIVVGGCLVVAGAILVSL